MASSGTSLAGEQESVFIFGQLPAEPFRARCGADEDEQPT